MRENTELKSLLEKISNNLVPANEFELRAAFDDIAILLLNRSVLRVKDALHNTSVGYTIREVEFYFYSKNYNHVDPHVHAIRFPKSGRAKRQQGKCGYWYLHHLKTPKTDNRNGLDLTFGKDSSANFGGILLRQIQLLTGSENNPIPLNGPAMITKELAGRLIKPEYAEINEIDEMQALNSDSRLYIDMATEDQHCTKPIYKRTRELPAIMDSDLGGKYFNENYRYFNYPEIKEVWPAKP